MKSTFIILIEGQSARRVVLKGRYAWALKALVEASGTGCTPIDTPGPRWSAYIYVLRHEYGLDIETITEPHKGPFPGTHARYVLNSNVELVFAGAVDGAAA